MIQTLSIATGGALGAVARYWMSNGVHALLGRDFPYGTLLVNVLGSLLMGVMFVLLNERMAVPVQWRASILIGLLGAFTTFSTFSMETLNLIETGEPVKAGANVLASVLLCLVACWAGVVFAREL